METRDELLKKLKSIDGILIGDLTITYDIGMQFEYASAEGYGYEGGYNIANWPLTHVRDNRMTDKWDNIISKIKAGNLAHEDITGTWLEDFINDLEYMSAFPETDEEKDTKTNKPKLSNFLKPLEAISKEEASDIYVMFDGGTWYFVDRLVVSATLETVAKAFAKKYLSFQPWDNLATEQLQEWVDKLENMNRLFCLGYNSDEDDEEVDEDDENS